jgi:hypothetical protein
VYIGSGTFNKFNGSVYGSNGEYKQNIADSGPALYKLPDSTVIVDGEFKTEPIADNF